MHIYFIILINLVFQCLARCYCCKILNISTLHQLFNGQWINKIFLCIASLFIVNI